MLQRCTGLLLCPFSDTLTTALEQRCDMVRWFEMDGQAQQDWLAAHAALARFVITGGHIGCSNDLMRALPNLGLVAINGVGFDRVDLVLARARSVAVTTTPGVLTEDVADLAVGLVIALLRGVPEAHAHVRAGAWPNGEMRLARKVSGRRFGIVGLGRIGSAIAARLSAFGPVAYTDLKKGVAPYAYHPDARSLAENSDILIVASSADATTHGMINADVLSALGAQGYLVNVSRGSVVDEAELIAALQDGRIAGAALDVFENEPHVPEALRGHPSVLLTPHIASATVETRQEMAELVLQNLDAFLAGHAPPSALP